jgi:hypothetical protein
MVSDRVKVEAHRAALKVDGLNFNGAPREWPAVGHNQDLVDTTHVRRRLCFTF